MSGGAGASNMPLMRVQQELIVINSDSETDCEDELQTNPADQSVFIVEAEGEKNDVPQQAPKVVDEDLIITFSQRAEVLPHARYDCPVYPFQFTDEKRVVVNSNFLICEQCYCYICDKPASQCETWTVTEACHCNSHKKNEYWRGLRDARLLGFLRDFNITLTEMDTRLRDAEVMLGSFAVELANVYGSFLRGKSLTEYGVYSMQATIYDYTPVYECAKTFLDKADSQDDRAAAVMRLGAAKNFLGHFQPTGVSISSSPVASATTAKALLIERVLESVQRQMILADFGPEFYGKLQLYYQNLSLPHALKWKLNLRSWNDMLLVSVLRGQNVSGVYKATKGKKDTLVEELPVILLRVQHLQNQHRFRELCRYLRVVLCAGSQEHQTRLLEVTDLLPLYLCWTGDLGEAMSQFFVSSRKCPTFRLSPFYFQLYLHILETGTAPVLTAALPTQATLAAAKWERIEGAVPRLHTRLVGFALRVMKIQKDIYSNSACWEALLSMVNTTPAPLEEPSHHYLQDARTIVRKELNKATHMDNICFPLALVQMYPRQGFLLLMTEALAMRIASGPLEPAIPVVNTFKENEWAFQWLCESLMSYSPDIYLSFMKGLLQELQKSTPPTPAVSHDATNTVCVCGKICKNHQGLRTHQRWTGCGAAGGTAQASAVNASPQWLLPHPLSYYYPSLSININVKP